MSTIHLGKVWGITGLTSTQKLVLVSLCDQANDDGVCWPGVKSITRRTSLGERAVQTALTALEGMHLIERDYRHNKSTNYTVTLDKYQPTAKAKKPKATPAADAPPALNAPPAPNAPPAANAPGAPTAPPPALNAPPPAPGAPLDPHQVHPNHKGTIKEPSLNLSAGQAKAKPAMEVVDTRGQTHVIPAELKYPSPETKSHKTWVAYAISYEQRYGVWPIWNQSAGGKITKFIDSVGADLAPRVAAFYVMKVLEPQIVTAMHPLGLLLAQAQKWATQAQSKRQAPPARAGGPRAEDFASKDYGNGVQSL